MLEIACFDITSAETAMQSPADRIELCKDISQGGLTPEIEEFKYLKEKFLKPIYVMIRPIGGGFFYDNVEFNRMIKSIEQFKIWGADGFVFGILTADNKIDIDRNSFLVQLAHPVPCTFHRAFDKSENLNEACEDLIKAGFENVLTSGGESEAALGTEKLKKLVKNYSNQINILIGGGLRSINIEDIKKETGGTYFHSSAILPYEYFANEEEIRKLKKLSV